MKKNIFLLLAFLSYFLLIVSCGSNNNKVEKKDILPMIGNNGFKWYMFESNGKYGICDSDGEILEDPEYESIDYIAEGDFFEMEQLVDENKFLVIKDKKLDTKIFVEDRVVNYKKRKLPDQKRFYYNIESLNENGDTLVSACDKNWRFTVVPIPKSKYEIKYNSGIENDEEKFESFLLSTRLHGKFVNVYIPTKLDNNGNGVNYHLNAIFLYRIIAPNQPDLEFNHYQTVIYCDDYIVIGSQIFYFYKEIEGEKIYKRQNNEYFTLYFVDDNYNIREGYGKNIESIINEESYVPLQYEHAWDSNGLNYILHFYEEYEKAKDIFRFGMSHKEKNETDDINL